MSETAAVSDRRDRKQGAKKPSSKQQKLTESITPPEGVPIRFDVAGLGVRTGAQLVDVLVTMIFSIAVIAILALAFRAPGSLLMTLFAFFWLATRAPYYIITELLWNGATLGKRMLKIRVVSADGRSLTTHGIVVRNLMKEAEVFAPGTALFALPALNAFWTIVILIWIAAALAVPLFNKRRQRLGDLMGGTYVVHQPVALLLPDLTARAPAKFEERHVFLPHQLDHYGAFELQTLEKLLHNAEAGQSTPQATERRRELVAAVVEKIRVKIDYPEAVPEAEHEKFLSAFYAAQRRHLEQRRLFGDKRLDKHHRTKGGGDPDNTD